MNSVQSALAIKYVKKVKDFAKGRMDLQKKNKGASTDSGSEDIAQIVCYAVALMLHDPGLIAAYNSIIDPQSGAPIGTPCGQIINSMTTEK